MWFVLRVLLRLLRWLFVTRWRSVIAERQAAEWAPRGERLARFVPAPCDLPAPHPDEDGQPDALVVRIARAWTPSREHPMDDDTTIMPAIRAACRDWDVLEVADDPDQLHQPHGAASHSEHRLGPPPRTRAAPRAGRQAARRPDPRRADPPLRHTATRLAGAPRQRHCEADRPGWGSLADRAAIGGAPGRSRGGPLTGGRGGAPDPHLTVTAAARLSRLTATPPVQSGGCGIPAFLPPVCPPSAPRRHAPAATRPAAF